MKSYDSKWKGVSRKDAKNAKKYGRGREVAAQRATGYLRAVPV
jgi:hypothetical protein